MTRVMVVDDQQMFRVGLRAILQAQDDVEVVGEASDGAEAVREALLSRPDVVVLEVVGRYIFALSLENSGGMGRPEGPGGRKAGPAEARPFRE